MEVAIAKIVIGLVGSWIIAWTPYSLIALLGISGQAHLVTPFNSMLPALFAKTAACIDPFIYSLNHPKIRQEILFRLYNSFLVSIGRRGESLNSDSARQHEWKMSGTGRFNRKTLVNPSLVQPGRVGSLASFRKFNKPGLPTLASSGPGGLGSASVREEARPSSVSFSSDESGTGQAEGLEEAEIMAEMMKSNNAQQRGQYHDEWLLSNCNETYHVAPRDIDIILKDLDLAQESSMSGTGGKTDETANNTSMSSTL